MKLQFYVRVKDMIDIMYAPFGGRESAIINLELEQLNLYQQYEKNKTFKTHKSSATLTQFFRFCKSENNRDLRLSIPSFVFVMDQTLTNK